MSWVILDCLSDMISYDQKHGLRSAESERAVVTTTCEGQMLTDMSNVSDQRRVSYAASLLHPQMKTLDEKMWIEGDTSIAYGREIADDGKLFSFNYIIAF